MKTVPTLRVALEKALMRGVFCAAPALLLGLVVYGLLGSIARAAIVFASVMFGIAVTTLRPDRGEC